MTYLLYRTDRVGAQPHKPPLGAFQDFDSALAARDDDLVAQLHRRPSPPREIAHLIVSSEAATAPGACPVVTFAGADPHCTDPVGEIEETRRWLDRIRGR